jgi:hypothetical protein
MARTFDPMLTALNAVTNGSRIPVAADDIVRILSGGSGDPSHMRALFGDVALSALIRLAIAYDISDEILASAYVRARSKYAAANPELDQFARDILGADAG